MKNNPNCPQPDDFDDNGITRNDIFRLINSRYGIIGRKNNYEIRDKQYRFTVAIGFYTWSDALAYLLEDVEVI